MQHQPHYPSAIRVAAASLAMAGREHEAKEMTERLCQFVLAIGTIRLGGRPIVRGLVHDIACRSRGSSIANVVWLLTEPLHRSGDRVDDFLLFHSDVNIPADKLKQAQFKIGAPSRWVGLS
ncbi:hypothetical protein QO004_003072 [Rhizobium mesoamericanum]|uniref:hypothetical protein n=1 Tax=Rhizobium mesoamericanum TaxID=1079800 RepID=UPI002782D96E|nr:hypothetical protein [Rhizobium mesoamericanum]MDQ0561279.1 hypothetical protein [Rhizobium mesoamericanum]